MAQTSETVPSNVGAKIIRLGFWGILYYNHNMEPPQLVWIIMKPPILPRQCVKITGKMWLGKGLGICGLRPQGLGYKCCYDYVPL